ncbi:class F sortase [Streptomyces flavalbus]|uniref:Class F sortase n=1 Tax=Streptomyces flavalbus TaxID=2665155 RepID=A0ABW2WI57_9ACTN
MTVCGLTAVATGRLLAGAPPTAPQDVGDVPAGVSRAAADRAATTSPPVLVRGPRGLHAPVVPVASRPDGSLDLPRDARTAGWWPLGAGTGAAHGTLLIAGHVDTRQDGLGPFAALHGLPMGSRIAVTGADGTVRAYRVAARRTYRQERLPRDLFASDGTHRLALVTCAAPYDRTEGRYLRNLVLYATPAGAPAP